MDDIDSLIDTLSGEGELNSGGRFTVDLAAARDRYQRFLSSDPQLYLARLVRAAVLARASEIRISEARGSIVMRVPQLLCPLDEVATLLERLDGPHQHPAKQLAMGLLMALQSGPELVELGLASPERVVRMRMQAGRTSLETLPGGALAGSYIRIQFPTNFRNLLRKPPEVKRIEELFRFAPTPIWVNEHLVQQDWSREAGPRAMQLVIQEEELVEIPVYWFFSPPYWGEHQAIQVRYPGQGLGLISPTRAHALVDYTGGEEEFGYGCVLGLFCKPSLGEKLTLVYAGEQLEVVQASLPFCVSAVVDCTDLQLDIAGAQLVKNADYQQRYTQVLERGAALSKRLALRYPAAKKGDYRSALLSDRKFKGVFTQL